MRPDDHPRGEPQSGAERSTARPAALDSELDGAPLDGTADRLQRIAARIEDFLAVQIQRLESLLEKCQIQAAPQSLVEPSLAKMHEERRRWEDERQRERERLQADAARLAEAWQRVEAEQRRLLAQRDTARATTAAGLGAATHDEELSGNDPEPRPCRARCSRHAPGEAEADEQALSAEMAALQFQQLRREVERHTRRRR